jgi:hypothetical protein
MLMCYSCQVRYMKGQQVVRRLFTGGTTVYIFRENHNQSDHFLFLADIFNFWLAWIMLSLFDCLVTFSSCKILNLKDYFNI